MSEEKDHDQSAFAEGMEAPGTVRYGNESPGIGSH